MNKKKCNLIDKSDMFPFHNFISEITPYKCNKKIITLWNALPNENKLLELFVHFLDIDIIHKNCKYNKNNNNILLYEYKNTRFNEITIDSQILILFSKSIIDVRYMIVDIIKLLENTKFISRAPKVLFIFAPSLVNNKDKSNTFIYLCKDEIKNIIFYALIEQFFDYVYFFQLRTEDFDIIKNICTIMKKHFNII